MNNENLEEIVRDIENRTGIAIGNIALEIENMKKEIDILKAKLNR